MNMGRLSQSFDAANATWAKPPLVDFRSDGKSAKIKWLGN
jgi:hypothetical protein